MKVIFVLVVAISVAVAFPADDEKPKPEVITNEYVNNGDKGYNFKVETSDGSKHEEVGDFKYIGGLAVRGSYEFIDEEGRTRKVDYIADEKGFRPTIHDP